MRIKELGHVVLYVRDLQRSRKFYASVLGWKEVAFYGFMAAFSSGRTHHELLLIQVGADATPIPEEPRLGMYHFGLKIGDSDDELRQAITELRAAGVPIVGMSDHGVSHSVYIKDPDGNEIELYIDVQPELWREKPLTSIMGTRPLRI
ncbi:MAG TPA: VOC family protein [Candidatus Binataceae bacterium]|nr:VOC family protein [Candidatus Binataceae bacterium]